MPAAHPDVNTTLPSATAVPRGGAPVRVAQPEPGLQAAELLTRLLYPWFRAFPFRGLGRLRRLLPIPEGGVSVASFPGGFKLRLDLTESLQRDFLFGLYDRLELSVLRRALRDGGDFVDVGAHVGMYTVAAARALAPFGGSVLAIEPNPGACTQLRRNLWLNGLDADLVPKAASDGARTAMLHLSGTSDISWSSLEQRPSVRDGAIAVQTTTVDEEVAARALRPVLVKIDVEGHELSALAGMQDTILEHRPTILCEVDRQTARTIDASLATEGFRCFHNVAGRALRAGVDGVRADANVFFVPEEKLDVIPPRLRGERRRRALLSAGSG